MAEYKARKEYYDLVVYVKNKRQKIGYATKTEQGSIFLKADDLGAVCKLSEPFQYAGHTHES